MRSRWAMVACPLVVMLAFELRWAWLGGPTVDAPQLDTSYGILALLLGRGFFFLVCIVPMLLGVACKMGSLCVERLGRCTTRESTPRA
jgi:proline iminopeptidase